MSSSALHRKVAGLFVAAGVPAGRTACETPAATRHWSPCDVVLDSPRIMGGRLLLSLSLLCLVAAFPVVASAADVPDAIRDRFGDDVDQKEVVSLDFMLALSLTVTQAQAILPHYEEACLLHTAAYDTRAEIQPLEIEAYAEFLAEDRLDQGFTPEVERRTAHIHHRAIQTREGFHTDLNALAEDIWEVLTPDQQRIAADYKPDRKAIFKRFATLQERKKAARRAARRARRGQGQRRPEDPQLKEARDELDAIRRATHVRPGAIAEHLLTPVAAETLYELAGARIPEAVRNAVRCRKYGTRDYPMSRCEQDQQTLHGLQKEINSWNLTNGMHFSREQIEQLVRLANEAERLRTTQRQARPKDKLPRDAFNAELVKLELAAEAVLRPGQLEVMDTYSPCLLPPKNLKDPVRVGQASDGTRMARWLEHARRKNDRQIGRMVDRLIGGEIAHLGPMDETAEAQRRSLLRETVRRAAEMSNVEFALNKDDLASAIQPENRKDGLIADIDTMRRERAVPGRTCQFLLNESFANVLKVRYEQLSP